MRCCKYQLAFSFFFSLLSLTCVWRVVRACMKMYLRTVCMRTAVVLRTNATATEEYVRLTFYLKVRFWWRLLPLSRGRNNRCRLVSRLTLAGASILACAALAVFLLTRKLFGRITRLFESLTLYIIFCNVLSIIFIRTPMTVQRQTSRASWS